MMADPFVRGIEHLQDLREDLRRGLSRVIRIPWSVTHAVRTIELFTKRPV